MRLWLWRQLRLIVTGCCNWRLRRLPIDIESLRSALAGRYTIENEIGRGGMATVYRAEDQKHHRKVAVKILRPEIASSLGIERFLQEIEVLASLQHPHILPLYDSGQAGGFVYFVMPFVDGESLRARLNRERQLPLADALQITREIAAALDYAHSRNVIHRDIKPENIMFSGGMAVLADFGIARAVSAADQRRLTQTGTAVGTPVYMSPEQGGADVEVDGRSDIYALGCVLYETLVGDPPHTGSSPQVILARKSVEPVRSIRVVRETIPESVEDAVMMALARSPADRFATASDFAAALPVMQTGSGTPIPHYTTAIRRRPSGRIIGYMAAATIALAAVAWMLRDPGFSGSGTTRLTVLPFENRGAAEDEYFADGITDEIATRLAGVPGLSVIARQSAIQYKNSKKTAREIGDELKVDYLLEATVSWQHSADGSSRVRVRPQLIKTSDGSTIWGQVYDEDMTEVFAVQTSIAKQVVDTLGITLLDTHRKNIELKPTDNLAAYDFYLQGKDFFHRPVSEENLRFAESMYSQALDLDPKFALAAAELSTIHSRIYWYFFDRSPQRLLKAKAAADSAFALAPALPEAHMALGEFYYRGSLDYDRALREFAAERELRPNDSEVLMNIGAVERRQAKWSEAEDHINLASEWEPRSTTIAVQAAITYFFQRKYRKARRHVKRATSFAPDELRPHVLEALIQVHWKGDTARARVALEQAERVNPGALDPQAWLHWGLYRILDEALDVSLSSLKTFNTDRTFYYLAAAEIFGLADHPDVMTSYYDSARVILETRLGTQPDEARFHSELGIAYAGLGQRDKAIREGELAVELLPISKEAIRGPNMVRNLAQIYLMLGMFDESVARLEELLAVPSSMSANWLRFDPLWRDLRDHPKFQRLVN